MPNSEESETRDPGDNRKTYPPASAEEQDWRELARQRREREWQEKENDEAAPAQAPPAQAPPIPTCNHLREDGSYCGSPAMEHRKYCYFHLGERARRLRMARAISRREKWRFELGALDSLASVQIAIQRVGQAVALELLDTRRANTLVRVLSLMSANLRQPAEVWNRSNGALQPCADRLASSYDNVEQEFGLSKTLDLDTPPEVAFPDPPPENREYQDLLHVTPLDIELAELNVRQGYQAVRQRMQKATHAEQMAIRRKNEQLEHALRMVKAEARSAERYDTVMHECSARTEIERHGWLPGGKDLAPDKKPPQTAGIAGEEAAAK